MAQFLLELEKQISRLSYVDKLQLLEKLAHDLRQDALSNDLDAMAADENIKRELAAIDNEFRITEEDGLRGL